MSEHKRKQLRIYIEGTMIGFNEHEVEWWHFTPYGVVVTVQHVERIWPWHRIQSVEIIDKDKL